jgi:hypothetical protein
MAMTIIPECIYKIGEARKVKLPSGYYVTQDLNNYWLQNTQNTGGVLLRITKQEKWESTYCFSKKEAESLIRQPLMRVIGYQLESKI